MRKPNTTAIIDYPTTKIAVPNLSSYSLHSGIGRHVGSLIEAWGDRCQVVDAPYLRSPLPILRSYPVRVTLPEDAQLLFIPQIAGAQILRTIRHLPSVVVVHDVGVVDCKQDMIETDWITKRIVMGSFRSLRYADRIVVPSEFTARRLVAHLPEISDRVTVVASGVRRFFSHRKLRNESRLDIEREFGKHLGDPLLIYVGSEIPRKNISFLLQLLQRIKIDFPNAMLLKVGSAGGDRWRRRTLEEMGRRNLRLGEDVFIIEAVSDDVLVTAYRAANVCVLPSYYEGFGLPAAEALMSGTPVVVASGHAMEEVVDGFGWALPLDLEQWVDIVAGIFRDPQSKSERPTYDWDRTAEQYLSIIHEEVSRRRPLGRV